MKRSLTRSNGAMVDLANAPAIPPKYDKMQAE